MSEFGRHEAGQFNAPLPPVVPGDSVVPAWQGEIRRPDAPAVVAAAETGATPPGDAGLGNFPDSRHPPDDTTYPQRPAAAAADASLPATPAESGDLPAVAHPDRSDASDRPTAADVVSQSIAPERPYFLPELQRRIDDLRPQDITPRSTAEVIVLHVDYGSSSVRQAAVDQAAAKAVERADELIVDIQDFMASNTDEGARSPIGNAYAYFNGSYMIPQELGHYLTVAQRLDPDIGNRVIGDIVEAATTAYVANAEALNLTIIDGDPHLFRYAMVEFTSELVQYLADVPTDGEAAATLADSAYIQEYGNSVVRAHLECIAAEAQARESPDEASAIYAELFARSLFSDEYVNNPFAQGLILQEVSMNSPDCLAEALRQADPALADILYGYFVDGVIRESHDNSLRVTQELWAAVVAHEPGEKTYFNFLPAFVKDNMPTAAQLDGAKRLLIEQDTTSVLPAYQPLKLIISMYTPAHELAELAATFPLQCMNQMMVGIIVKRLAMQGDAFAANDLASRYYSHVNERAREMPAVFRAVRMRNNDRHFVHSLLDIYAETGDEQAWTAVWRYYPFAVRDSAPQWDYSFRAHAFVAAHKQGGRERATEQAALLVAAEREFIRQSKAKQLPLESIQAYLECNLPVAAEAVITTLWSDAMMAAGDYMRWMVADLTLDVIYGYAQLGLHADAQRLVMEYFMNPQRLPISVYALRKALDCARGIDATTSSGQYSTDILKQAAAQLRMGTDNETA